MNRQISLRSPLAIILLCTAALVGCVFLVSMLKAQQAMVRTAYGGQRMTRSEANQLAAKNWRWYLFHLNRLPDHEFLPER